VALAGWADVGPVASADVEPVVAATEDGVPAVVVKELVVAAGLVMVAVAVPHPLWIHPSVLPLREPNSLAMCLRLQSSYYSQLHLLATRSQPSSIEVWKH
jgi:hypothetical protein